MTEKKPNFIFFKDGILNSIEHRVQIEKNHDSEKWNIKGQYREI